MAQATMWREVVRNVRGRGGRCVIENVEVMFDDDMIGEAGEGWLDSNVMVCLGTERCSKQRS